MTVPSAPRRPWAPLSCAEFVGLVSAYLDGELDRDTEGCFADHATSCARCGIHLDARRWVRRRLPERPVTRKAVESAG